MTEENEKNCKIDVTQKSEEIIRISVHLGAELNTYLVGGVRDRELD